jgi:hypothetical protein
MRRKKWIKKAPNPQNSCKNAIFNPIKALHNNVGAILQVIFLLYNDINHSGLEGEYL